MHGKRSKDYLCPGCHTCIEAGNWHSCAETLDTAPTPAPAPPSQHFETLTQITQILTTAGIPERDDADRLYTLPERVLVLAKPRPPEGYAAGFRAGVEAAAGLVEQYRRIDAPELLATAIRALAAPPALEEQETP